MNFLPNDTLAGYARTAVDLRARMVDYHRSPLAAQYLQPFFGSRLADRPSPSSGGMAKILTAVRAITANPWRFGEPYVIAPAMTAIIAAAAAALDLTGEVLPADVAPDDGGVLFLPEPIYHCGVSGEVSSIGAITWARTTNTSSGRSFWAIAGWADHHDAHDPAAVRRRAQLADRPDLARQFGPYVLTDFTEIPIGRPVDPRPDLPVLDGDDRDWDRRPTAGSVLTRPRPRCGPAPLSPMPSGVSRPNPSRPSPPHPWTARRGAVLCGPASAMTPVWSCCAAPALSPSRPTASPSGTTGCGSSSAATGDASSTATATPTASASTPTSKARTGRLAARREGGRPRPLTPAPARRPRAAAPQARGLHRPRDPPARCRPCLEGVQS
ncbi:hypothetical protein ACQEUV_05475 [Micromonospora aurantiaca (nom. illeg.)]|uniref:hypothetical protein n=1 Tax=Micromonospora aurantiaca (nom. illeg.) TaxID=47850 RepID=UPI003DA3DB37